MVAYMKKIIALILACLMLSTSAFAVESFVEEEPTWEPAQQAIVTMDNIKVAVPSAILLEKTTGKIIYEHNAHQKLAPASITKIMTILLVVEAIEKGTISLKDKVTASTYAAGMGGSQIFLSEGESMGLEEMLKAVVVCSANDAAVALAEYLAGSESSFVAQMNARAKELGMQDTVFSNCTGLPVKEDHYTSAYDVALMSRELIKHDMIKKYTTIWMDKVRNGQFGITNTNRLVRFFSGTTGLKTGFTDEAMYCLSATAERDGAEYIAVVMHAATSDIRFETAKTLLSYAFSTYTLANAKPDEAPLPVPVELGVTAYVQPVVHGETNLLMKKSEATGLTKTVELEKSVKAPVAKGQQIGMLFVKNQKGAVIAQYPLVAAESVARMNWRQIFTRYFQLMTTGRL